MNSDLAQELWSKEVASIAVPPADWLWHGFVARGSLTLLTSMWKAGKTTLLTLLRSRRHTGGDLAGLAVKPGKSIVVSEEDSSLWAERRRTGPHRPQPAVRNPPRAKKAPALTPASGRHTARQQLQSPRRASRR